MAAALTLSWTAVPSAGKVGSTVVLGKLAVTTLGGGADTLQSLIIDGIPPGATLTDGVNSFLAGLQAGSVDVSGWNLSALSILVPAAATFTLTAVATTQDAAGILTSASATEAISVAPATTLDATTSAGVLTPAYNDGSANAPAGTPQLAGLLSSVVRPPWKVAGVDYAVGVPAGTSLLDPATITMAGVSVDANTHVITINGNNVTLSGYDFGLAGGWGINIVSGANTVIQNSNFLVGSNLNVPIVASSVAGNLTIRDDTFNGGGGSTDAVWALTDYRGQGTFIAQFDSFLNAPSDAIDFGAGPMTTIVEYNLFGNLGTAPGSHPDAVQYDATTSNNSVIAFNTVTSGEEGIQLAAQDGSSLTNTTIDNNVIIAPPLVQTVQGLQPQMSFSIAIQQFLGNTIDGVVVDNNYIDASNAFGPFYTPTGSNITFSGNVDLTSGGQIGSPPSVTSSDVSSVAVSPANGTAAAGSTITISLNMDKVVSVGGTPTLSLNNGDTATYQSGSGSKLLTFTYTVGSAATAIASLSVTAVNLPGGATVTDSFGNAANLSGALVTFADPVVSSAGHARVLLWNDSNPSDFSSVLNWTDRTSGTAQPATAAPTSVDTVEFFGNGTAITGTGTAGSMTFDSNGGGWQMVSAVVNVAGTVTVGVSSANQLLITNGSTLVEGDSAIIANTVLASNSSVVVTGSSTGPGSTTIPASSWRITGALIVGDAGFGSLSISQGGTVTATSANLAAASGGDGVITVAGIGSALNLAGSLTVGSQAAGELSVLAGATVTALDLTIGNASAASSGNVDVEGAGSTLHILNGGILNIGVAGGGSGILTIGTNATLSFSGTIVEAGHASFNNNGGVVDPDAGKITSTSNAGLGENDYGLYLDNMGAVQVSDGTGIWNMGMLLTGTSVADAATNLARGRRGQWQLSSGGTLVINSNTVDAGQVIVFEDNTDTLVIGQVVNGGQPGTIGQEPTVLAGAENLLQAGGFQAAIWGYEAGDQILFNNLAVVGDQIVNGNTLELLGVGNVNLGSLTFRSQFGDAPLNAADMAAAAAQVACFAAGTLIETVDGPRAVEDLAVGDEVVTLLGGPGRIVWVGSRAVDCARHPRPEAVWPVRIAAGAFGENVPARDLFVSPDHAVFVNDVLVPARLLVNGTTIVQIRRDRIVYHHVELPEHAVILAEGLTVESYLDVGDRTNFDQDGETIRLFPEFATRIKSESALLWETHGVAPLVLAGPDLEMARRADVRTPVAEAACRVSISRR